MKRELDIAILSDTHLGTYGCHAKELLQYLQHIKPKTLILNGDFIDIWQFRKRYFPKEHLQIVQRILKMAEKGTKVYYITGNHDDALRRLGILTTPAMVINGSPAPFDRSAAFGN
jgi:UDP-2,3-diacylglucosamine pyrophosphatase LpxH